ncbi:MAG TPA: preprotein translocase subunit YajC [Planctomycetota bacterium]|nr:preprotein translocase subunit YajC [Planctomycetota bacterium]HRR80624.1 preprotein translocase subunit YajC [Planctomycetota bacterium]HRT97743.1 preprotein translocase subunit YajC [Planctomycetota bacterium]
MNPFPTLWPALPIVSQAAPQPPGGNPLMQSLLFIGVMFAILYFLMIRPQRKRQREHMDMLAALRKGDKVITRGGIHGVVTLVRDREVKVKVDSNCELTLSKSAIAGVVTPGSDEGDKEADKS